jgi:hypothetical protein
VPRHLQIHMGEKPAPLHPLQATLALLPRCPHCHAIRFATPTTVPRRLHVAMAVLPCRPRCHAVRAVTPSALPHRLRCLASCVLRQPCCHAGPAATLSALTICACHAICSVTLSTLPRRPFCYASCATTSVTSWDFWGLVFVFIDIVFYEFLCFL